MLGLVGLGLVSLVLTGCSRSLAADDIERELERQLSTQQFVPEVTCNDDLPGEVGATITCDSTLEKGLDVLITVTARQVDGDQIRYTFSVEPRGVPSPPSTSPTTPSGSGSSVSGTTPTTPPGMGQEPPSPD
jgi:hypothetical protein